MMTAINSIPSLPYGTHDTGGTEDLKHQGTTIVRKGTTSLCVSAVYEAIHRYINLRGWTWVLSVDDMIELKKWTYVYLDHEGQLPSEAKFYGGAPRGIVELGLGHFVQSADAEPGDLLQFFDYEIDSGDYLFGHSAIITGTSTNSQGEAALGAWSSDGSTNDGMGNDYWSIVHPDPSINRVIFLSRFLQERR